MASGVEIADFLADCAESLRGSECVPPLDAKIVSAEEFLVARDIFLVGGLPALRARLQSSAWIQAGLAFGPERHAQVCGAVLATARELLDRPEVWDFFFMHKPPGMRVRVRTTGAAREAVAAVLYRRLEQAADTVVPSAYEAEAHLFGGLVSMESVHRLFTADSLLWLSYHAEQDPSPAWAVSLAMLRSLLAALGVAGWEDRDVWDRVRRQAFRSLAEPGRKAAAFASAAARMRQAWADPGLTEQLTARSRELLAEHEQTMAAEIPRWRARYFATRGAYVGPREAAAYYIAFHWNRARLSGARQGFIAEALAGS